MKARASGAHYTDITLWDTAMYLLHMGNERERGSAHPFLAAAVFAFFAFEANLNEMGRRLDPEVWAQERRHFKRKITIREFRHLAELTGYTCSWGERPLQTVLELGTVRDALAHGRTEEYDEETTVELAEDVGGEPAIERWRTAHFARKAVEDVERAANGLFDAALARFPHMVWGRASAFVGVSSESKIDIIRE